MDINSIYELIKNITQDLKGLADKSLANAIMNNLFELQEKIIDLKAAEAKQLEEIDELKKHIELLEKAKDVRWTSKGYGIFVDENGVEHRYCQHCFAKTGKLYDIPKTGYGGRCPECNDYLNF